MSAMPLSPDTRSWQGPASTGPAPPATVANSPAIPGFEVRRELGRGGMGVVYEAVDHRLGRAVAVKMLLAGGAADPARLERFQVECAALARLSHPHILTVHQGGVTAQGLPFLVTELVPGGSLAGKAAQQPQDPDVSARLVLLLARAVQAAHAAGILHRDLKPANVLLAEPAPEPALNCAWGWPKLADFGLAKFLESDQPGATHSGQMMGSPPYMSPEQVAGDLKNIGPATDVYGLGAILYELLTGRMPFPNLFRDRPPVPPRELRPELPPALEAVCLKCLAREPRDRYASAAALADALQAHLDGAALPDTAAVSPPPLTKSRTSLAVLAAGAALVLLFLGGWGLSAYLGSHPAVPDLPPASPAALAPLSGELEVLLWSDADPRKRGLRVQAPGALPARAEEKIQIQARLNAPGYVYLVLIDSQGKAVPLHPWNPERRITVREFLPAAGAPVAEVRSPPGERDGWKLDKNDGLETVLLLVRRTPLEADLTPLLTGLPPAQLRDPAELLERGYDADGPVQRLFDQHRGIEDEAARIDEPLLKLLDRLRPHFELVRVVRFAHQGQ